MTGLPHAVSLGVPLEFASSWLPRFQPGIRFCENSTDAPPVVTSGAGAGASVSASVEVATVVSGAGVVASVVSGAGVVASVVSGAGVVASVVVAAVVVSVVVAAVVVVVVVSAAVVVVVVEAVVVAELLSTDEFAPPEQAEIPVTTIIPLIRAASILFFIRYLSFLSADAVFVVLIIL